MTLTLTKLTYNAGTWHFDEWGNYAHVYKDGTCQPTSPHDGYYMNLDKAKAEFERRGYQFIGEDVVEMEWE